VPAALRQLEANLARISAEKAAAEAGLQAETTQLAALNALAQRAAQRVGSCPSCGQRITGHDLLATGQCRTCGPRSPLGIRALRLVIVAYAGPRHGS
jgi:hypothetical protein